MIPHALRLRCLCVWILAGVSLSAPFGWGQINQETVAAEKCKAADAVASRDLDSSKVFLDFPHPALQLYVAPDGSDKNPGTRGQPFATLERARDAIRALVQNSGLPAGGIAVEVRGGAYPVRHSFVLSKEDSGTREAPIVYRAFRHERPVFGGGVRLKDFIPVADAAILARLPEEARGNVVCTDLTPCGVNSLNPLLLGGFASGNGFTTHPVIELFFDGKALPMSRYPNADVLHVSDVAVHDGGNAPNASGSKTGCIIYEGDRPARWSGEKDAMLYGYWCYDWADSYERIASIDTAKHEIAFSAPYHTYGYKKGARYYAVNLLSEIDMPGEWFLDRESRILYLYPPSDPHKATIEIPLLEDPMLQMNDTAFVRFEGLHWELGCGDAIAVQGGEHCLFAGCTVSRFGGNGVCIKGGTAHGLLSCDIYSMGRGGTVIHGGDRKTLAPGGHFVANCHIHDLSRIDHTYTPAVVMNGVGNRITHNLMDHINSSAIRLEGNDHCIEFNEIHDVLLESDDQGGADMWGDPTFRGNVYRFNYWHHNGNWRRQGKDLACGQAGIRLDDAISGVLIYGNIFYKTSSGGAGFGGIQIHGGKDNILVNNLFADCTSAISFSPWGEDRWKAFVATTLLAPAIDPGLYQRRYPELAHLAENADINFVLRNRMWKCGEFLRRDKGRTVQADNGEADATLDFADAAHGDFTPTAHARKDSAFKPIPFGEIGLYRDAFRQKLPMKETRAARAQQTPVPKQQAAQ